VIVNIVTGLTRFYLPLALALFMVLGLSNTPLSAQTGGDGNFWIQVESQNNIRDTKSRAQVFARDFPDTRAFQTKTGWYAIVIGPMDEAAATTELDRLKADGKVPTDSFVTNGATYLGQLWPLSAGTDTVIATADEGTADKTPPEPETGPIPDPDLAATRKLEKSWSRDQKKEFQRYLIWTGDYKSTIDGAYGRGTRAAIKAFQSREGFQDTGYLTEAQTALLKQRFDDAAATLGIADLRNLDAGIEMKYPANLVEFDRLQSPYVRFKPKAGSDVRMMLISQKGGRAELDALYEIMETFDYIPKGGYRVKKRAWFVLSGRDENVVSYTFVRTDSRSVKGFTIIWPPAKNDIMQPFATMMYNSFSPLNDYVLDDTIGEDTTEQDPIDTAEDLTPPKPDHAASGFFINPEGVVITNSANVTGCSRVTINDGTVVFEVLAENTALSLVALRPTVEFTPPSYALFSDVTLKTGVDLGVAGFAFPEVMDIAALNYGTLTDTKGRFGSPAEIRLTAFLEDGDTGGPVLDDRGAVVGMQLAKSGLETDEPAYVNYALRASEITKMLKAAGIDFANSTSFDTLEDVDLAFMAGDFTVKVACWK
jgi:S1-C subfamily serine protease